MARPKKNNADYFSHDADMRNDPKVRALRRKYKHTGYAVWNYLLEVITDCDFFEVDWSFMNIELLAGDFDIDPEELRGIVDYCVSLDLLQVDNNMLSCKTLKERFKALLNKRNPVKAEFPEQKPRKSGVSDTENPQSKVKESKVNNTEKEFSFSDVRMSAEREKILEVFLFEKKLQNPTAEFDRFWNHYEAQGWRTARGVPITNRVAKAKKWDIPADAKRIDGHTAQLWKKLYDSVEGAPDKAIMLEGFTGIVVDGDSVVLRCDKNIPGFIERNIDRIRPVFTALFPLKKLIYRFPVDP